MSDSGEDEISSNEELETDEILMKLVSDFLVFVHYEFHYALMLSVLTLLHDCHFVSFP